MAGSSLPTPVAKRLDGKVAIITGGASGIGAATVRLFFQHGAKVVIADVLDDLALAVVEDIGCPETVSFIHCDVTKESDVKNVVDATVAKYGKLDIMFSNAGISGKPIWTILEAEYDILKSVFEVNVFGAFFCAKHAARVMIPAKQGNIIFTASAATVSFGDVSHPYGASKCATLGLAKNLGVELGQHGIRVNSISPYVVATPFGLSALGIDKKTAHELFLEAANLKGTVLEEDGVADAALYLASDDSKYVSGLNLVLDGGYTTTNKAFAVAFQKLGS